MDLQLKDKTALITGSTAGIGFAIAQALGREGCNVVINGRTDKRIAEAKEKLSATSIANVYSLKFDFSKTGDYRDLLATLPTIDILINNVGVFTSQSFEETTNEDWQRMIQVNLMSGVSLSRHLLPGMLSRNWGRVIFISSECATLVPQDLIAYSTTKAAINALSRGLAQTTQGSSVTVNSVAPGSTISEGAERYLEAMAQQEGKSMEQVEEYILGVTQQ